MRINIAVKLFIGYLVIIFLNVFLFVIVSKTQDLISIANILKHQNEIKNNLLNLRNLHNTQDLIAFSFERVGIKESVDNFRGVNEDIVLLIDSIKTQVDTVLYFNSLISRTTDFDYTNFSAHDYSETVLDVSLSNSIYNTLFDSVVTLRSSKTTRGAQRANVLASAMSEVRNTLVSGIDSILESIDLLNLSYLSEMESRVANVRQVTILIFTGMTLFSILFGFFFSRAITNSLRRLKDAANSLARGNFSIDPSGYPGDEIGDLASAFWNMAIDLKNAQEELVRSKRLAAIGEIVASVNHEINNPLMIISGNAQFLEMAMEGYPESIKERVRAILEETERISRITRKLREIRNPVSQDYTSSGEQMINLDESL